MTERVQLRGRSEPRIGDIGPALDAMVAIALDDLNRLLPDDDIGTAPPTSQSAPGFHDSSPGAFGSGPNSESSHDGGGR